MKLRKEQYLCEHAKEKYHVVDEIFYGYIFPDGTKIDIDDHTDIASMYKPKEWFKEKDGEKKYDGLHLKLKTPTDVYDAMQDFVKTCGCIMVHSTEPGSGKDIHSKKDLGYPFHLYLTAINKPTDEQITALKPIIEKASDFHAVRKFDINMGDLCDYGHAHPKPMHLQSWINKCW